MFRLLDDSDERLQKRDGARGKFLEAFAGNEDYPFHTVEDAYKNRSVYYGTMQANVMAEAVCAFRHGGASILSCRPGYDALVAFRPVEGATKEAVSNTAGKSEASDLQLKDNVVELSGALFWVTQCEIEEVTRKGVTGHEASLKGVGLLGRRLETALRPSLHPSGQEVCLKVRLFAGDYLARYQCAMELQHEPPLERMLEKMVLNPWHPEKGTYSPCRPFQRQLMSINEDQERAVKSLKSRVETIHGPPGTGKSTTIFHVLSARLPHGAAAVVTCVTNQAINAVTEKLSKTHEGTDGLRILVLGNPSRVGKTAGTYTLDNLCQRDALVVNMKWALNLLQKVLKAVEQLQWARQERLWRPHQRSRFGQAYIEGLPVIQRYRAELERDNVQRRRQLMPEEIYDPVKFYLERLNSTKQKMALAVVRSKPLRLPFRKFRGFLPSKTWEVEVFHERLRKCVVKADNALRVARDTAPSRVVRNTRVFLCTISSSYQVRTLQEYFPKDFPGRLAMSILDEAAATAETYVPLVIRIGVENLVMLGDHKQLNPLVLATGGDQVIKDKNVDRSFMERAMACNCPLHPLRTQYRMPDVLCKLVSKLFYSGHLRSDSDLTSRMRNLCLGCSPLRWFDIQDREMEVGTSKINCAEVMQIVARL